MRRKKLRATSEVVVSLKDVSKSFGSSTLFEDVSFDLMRGRRTALVGDNGSGKTTLIKIIAGLEDGDEGTFAVSSGAVISYLPQNISVFADEKTQYSIREFLAEPIPDLYEIAVKQSKLENNLLTCEDTSVRAELEANLEDLEYEFNSKEGWRVYKMLAELNLEAYELGTKIKELSGGEKTRLGLARAFLAEPDVLLLDEPTNYLDIDARIWLNAKLEKFSGAVLIITHDRYLLDRIVAEMLEIDINSKSVIRFSGNYQAYLQRKKADYERKLASYKSEDVQLGLFSKKKEKANIEIHRYSKRTDNSKLNYDLKGERVQQGRAKVVRKIIRDIETLAANRTIVPRKPVSVTFAFDANSESSEQFALTFNKIAKSYDTADKQILKNCSASITFGELVVIIGPNGAGKSTLLKILAGKLQPDAGEIKFGNGVVGYLDQEFESFDRTQSVADWLKQYTIDKTEAFKKLTQAGLNVKDILPKQIMQLSYGQQRKLQLLDLIIRGCDILLLDEPTNHMDLHSLEEFESVLAEFPGAVIAITHDQYFIENVASRVLRLENGELHMDAHNTALTEMSALPEEAESLDFHTRFLHLQSVDNPNIQKNATFISAYAKNTTQNNSSTTTLALTSNSPRLAQTNFFQSEKNLQLTVPNHYTVQIDGQAVRFEVQSVAGDGDCGYTAFGITRLQAYQLLVDHVKYLEKICHLVKPAVQEALRTQAFIEWLQNQDHLTHALAQAYANYLHASNTGGDMPQSILDELDRAGEDLTILLAYIDFDVKYKQIDNGWSHPCILFALAEIQGIELHIWQKIAQGALVPHQYYSEHIPTPVTQRTDLLFVNGNHFERLESVASLNLINNISTINTFKP